MDRGAWWATVHGGHEESDMTECACTDVCIKYQPLVYNGVEKKMMPLLSLQSFCDVIFPSLVLNMQVEYIITDCDDASPPSLVLVVVVLFSC